MFITENLLPPNGWHTRDSMKNLSKQDIGIL